MKTAKLIKIDAEANNNKFYNMTQLDDNNFEIHTFKFRIVLYPCKILKVKITFLLKVNKMKKTNLRNLFD